MPYVACPSCGERGKIPPNLVGARIKCKKCGNSFNVAPSAAKAGATEGTAVAAGQAIAAVSEAAGGGISVDGLDASAWEVAADGPSGVFKAEAVSRLVQKIQQGSRASETDDMALAGILSTQLLHSHFVEHFERRPQLLETDNLKVCRRDSVFGGTWKGGKETVVP